MRLARVVTEKVDAIHSAQSRFLIRFSHGQWRQPKADALLQVARDSLALWEGDGMDLAALAVDVALEAEQALISSVRSAPSTPASRTCTARPTLGPQGTGAGTMGRHGKPA